MLYLRMTISIIVSLYTSRVVLQTLGVEDFGIYSVVGGVVAMFSFLNGAMSGATSRFLTFEMGRGDKERLRETFSSALIIHLLIAAIVLILTETIGLWLLSNKLAIPAPRMHAAHWALQFSIIGAATSITQVPYNAIIIAHEKMDIYAYIELLNVFLKLAVVYLLDTGNSDKLILYSGLMLAVSVTTAMTYRIYCLKRYDESHFKPHLNRDISREIVSFSLYNLFGNIGNVVNTQGTSFVINIFFGVLYNAAASVGVTVSGVVAGFSNNVMVAFRPQITQSYARNDIRQFENLLSWAIRSILAISLLIAIPVGLLLPSILSVWLVEVPVYTDVFCRLLLISIFFETLRFIITMGIHATGRVKLVSLLTGATFCINPFIIYGLFKINLPPAYAYVTTICINLFLSICDILILKHNEPRISLRRLFGSASRKKDKLNKSHDG
jgi:O-antigen/teichoic acid export membrane protein